MLTITRMAELYVGWGDNIPEEQINGLNEVLDEMGAQVKVVYTEHEDAWKMKFVPVDR